MVIIMEKNEIVATVRSAEGETSDSIEKTIDFTELLLFFLNKLWIIVLITCVCGAGAYFYSRFMYCIVRKRCYYPRYTK